MAEKFYVVFNQSKLPHRQLVGSNRKHGTEAEFSEEAAEECMVVGLEAGSKAEARQAVYDKYGSDVTTLPITVKSANWEST